MSDEEYYRKSLGSYRMPDSFLALSIAMQWICVVGALVLIFYAGLTW